jgi:mRNA interferase MazF
VVPVTRTVRGLQTEVLLSAEDRMPTVCALNLDHLGLADRSRLGPLLAILPESRWPEVERALRIACGFQAAQET